MGIRFCLLLAACAVAVRGEDGLLLKSRRPDTMAEQLESPPARLSAGHSHRIVQFRSQPTAAQLAELERRGVRRLRYVPNFAYLTAVPDGVRLDDLARTLAMTAQDKISPLLGADGATDSFLIEFHPDVDPGLARALVRDHLLILREHPDLPPNQVLAEGNGANARRLAEWDEVAYVFPASRELVEGARVHVCAAAASMEGTVGQYVARVGPGWAASESGWVRLGVHFSSTATQLPPEDAQSQIRRALAEWSRQVRVDFVPGDALAPRTIDILFAARDHGDGYPFDGRGRVVAHTFYPAPPNVEPVAGDIHFDDEERWGTDTDLFTVALHEAGHALGLAHSDNPHAVMYPYYHRATGLDREDIDAIRQMYSSREETAAAGLKVFIDTPQALALSTTTSSIAMAGTVEGGEGEVQVSWTAGPGYSGPAAGARNWTIGAVPLEPGENLITVTAVDAGGEAAHATRSVTRTLEPDSPALEIAYPEDGQVFSQAFVTISGTTRGGVERVTWSNSRGGNGTAGGTVRWTAGPIALATGVNVIGVKAFAAGGVSAARSVTVTYTAPAQTDTVAPSLAITSPGSRTPSTYAAAIDIRGTASDASGILRVTWTDSPGNTGVASGTTEWATGAIPLRQGANTITIRAYDTAGNSSWRTLVVTRR